MPGLRRQPSISSYTNSIYHTDMLTPVPSIHQYSWHCESFIVSRPIATREVVPRQPLKSQKGTRDKCNYLGTKAASTALAAPVCYGSMESDNLLAMVHDFIENDPSEYMNGVDSDDSSSAKKLVENLLMRIAPSALERELTTEVELLLILVNDVMDAICEPGVSDCKGSCVNRFVVKHLRVAGYDAAECKSKWHCSGRIPGGEYEYIDVIVNDEQQTERLIVDVDFQAQFEIARPTQQYEAALKILPAVFVGSPTKLKQILEFMSEAAKASLQQSDMHLPPWRTLDYMRSKWLGTSERKTDSIPSSPTE
ncbi:uncharacterized protein [Physcomitrium patens]|uniref:Uncharacterized protein n=1 Tax=Physcomitrium patens TaxID=3218 RepID=A0A2K1IZQ1_PHYPA|nr:uncharacterized protein LOC112295419 [Physcomitrium patens]PNR34762.1 hypothetical protein PHYPA_022660 [Physcomitrium patens]|eukprot:XP_024402749.1 uncharacterized protein LOC112295419 [Physcomitrella patens]